MEYKYLAAWVQQNKQEDLIFQEIVKFQDQYAVKFKKTGLFLQVNLASENSFCFFSSRKKLPFDTDNGLNIINHTLSGSRLNAVVLAEKDRVILLEFTLLGLDNRIKHYRMILELIPRFQNILLTEKHETEELIVIDALKKFSFAENPARQILPNQIYQLPAANYQNSDEKVIFPLIFDRKGKISSSETRITGYYDINELFEDFYYDLILENRIIRMQEAVKRELQKKISKKELKLEKLRVELSATGKEELWKRRADLLKVNMNLLKPGISSVTVTDYFSEKQEPVEIPVRSDLSAQQNVNQFYKKYKKARDGKAKIGEQIRKTEVEIADLKMQQQIIEIDLFSIEKKKDGHLEKSASKFRTLSVNKDWEIMIGRTSQENDHLTTRVAKPYDWWFHTRVFKGTHVVLRNYSRKEVLPEKLLIICCRLAAYFSKAKKSSNVPVDYTRIRYVRKPRKSPPGYVIYSDQKTLYVDPISIREANLKINKWKRDENEN